MPVMLALRERKLLLSATANDAEVLSTGLGTGDVAGQARFSYGNCGSAPHRTILSWRFHAAAPLNLLRLRCPESPYLSQPPL